LSVGTELPVTEAGGQDIDDVGAGWYGGFRGTARK